MQNYHLFYASRNWTASPRQLSSKHQEENERQEGQTSLAEDSGGRKETTKTKLEYPPPPGNGERPTGMENPHCCPTRQRRNRQ